MQPDVREQMRVNVTDWNGVYRIDLNQLGARVPPELAAGVETREEARRAWAIAQNTGICNTMAEVTGCYDGNFDSFCEWSVTHGALYDGADMREKRRAMFTDPYRAAITSTGWLDRASGWGTRIQATSYIPGQGAHCAIKFWSPASLYETESMALAPAVVVTMGDARLLYISGVVAWDAQLNPLFTDDPQRQIRHVLETIGVVFAEAGGSRHNVLRLRPFTHSAEVATLLRAEVHAYWGVDLPPAMLVADSHSFGNSPKLYTEIQVMGVLAGDAGSIHHQRLAVPDNDNPGQALVIRSCQAPDWEMFEISEIRGDTGCNGDDEAASAVARLLRCMQAAGLTRDDVCLVTVYAHSAEMTQMITHRLSGAVPPESIHLVQCRPMLELQGGSVKIELTARRLAKQGR